MAGLVEIMDETIEEGFPELSGQSIGIKYKRLPSDTFLQINLGKDDEYDYELAVDNSLRAAPRIVKKGGIAHELSHVTDWTSMTRRQRSVDDRMYERHARYRVMDERNTDLRVVLRGLAGPLLTLHLYSEVIGRPYHREGGLSRLELTRLLGPNGNGRHVDEGVRREMKRFLKARA